MDQTDPQRLSCPMIRGAPASPNGTIHFSQRRRVIIVSLPAYGFKRIQGEWGRWARGPWHRIWERNTYVLRIILVPTRPHGKNARNPIFVTGTPPGHPFTFNYHPHVFLSRKSVFIIFSPPQKVVLKDTGWYCSAGPLYAWDCHMIGTLANTLP
jgi:hypothetical protein